MMTRAIGFAVVSAVLVGCGIPQETEEIGPTIYVIVDPDNSSSVESDDSFASSIPLDTTANAYNFEVRIQTQDGEINKKGSYNKTVVTGMVFSMEVAGETIPDSPMESDMSIAAVTYTRRDPVTLPATAMGKMIVVHAQATDEGGLHSNVVDWTVLLD